MHSEKNALAVNMARVEFGQLLAVMHALAPERCLEWGSGGSTRAVLEKCPFVKRYVSIEHDRLWYERVRSRVTDPRLELHLVPPAESIPAPSLLNVQRRRWNARAEIDRPLFAEYVAWPATLNVLFDLVFVDGRARRFCLSEGWMLLRPGGVLLLHDAQRRAYHDVLFSLGSPVLLEPWRQGQMALLRKPAADTAAAPLAGSVARIG